ncbi:MAG: hypothetical protein HY762_08090 [Planctomycetes bacterium]|nr:hypothetical protein [Planctomycetota bacterium]
MDDVIKLAAYVIIFIIIGGVSIIKKILEAQKQRHELEQKRAKLRQGGLRVEDDIRSETAAVPGIKPAETETEPPTGEAISIEDVLRELTGAEVVTETPRIMANPRRGKAIRRQEQKVEETEALNLEQRIQETVVPPRSSSGLHFAPPVEPEPAKESGSWNEFTESIKDRDEIQRAVIVAEVLKRPRGRL